MDAHDEMQAAIRGDEPAESQSDLTDVLGILRESGYEVVEGADAVIAAIASTSNGSTKKLCSGYRVFPGGVKCHGCTDCIPNAEVNGGAAAER